MVKIGDIVHERLQLETKTDKSYEGTVIYIHPKGRFYRAEFQLPFGKVREAFQLIQEREGKR